MEKFVYPAALLGLGLLGNKYIVRSEVKEEIKDVKEDIAGVKSSMQGLLTRQNNLEEHYKGTVARMCSSSGKEVRIA